jgi:2,5-dioxopentanoate dehydrogenase
MLNARTRRDFAAGVARLAAAPGVRTLLRADADPGHGPATPALFVCDVAAFLARPELHEEVFGPCTLLVGARSLDEMLGVSAQLEGQLTAGIHQASDDLAGAGPLIAALEALAGRIIFDGWPTGVEVCSAMVHGGPWPATTDSRFTSVGTGALRRWLRPVCWQDAPAAALASAHLPFTPCTR